MISKTALEKRLAFYLFINTCVLDVHLEVVYI